MKTLNLQKHKLLMEKLSINKLFIIAGVIFFGITNCYSQNESENINTLIEQKIAYNKSNKTSIVYKIQLCNGNETDAYKMKQNFQIAYPEYSTEIIYTAPEWKTHVGKFKTRLEADKVLKIVKEKFAGAIVLEDKV